MAITKIQHILTLSYLMSKGARHDFVTITTASLGRSIGRSQQAASRHLLELEQDGLVERAIDGGISVRITPKGYKEVARLHSILQKGMNTSPPAVRLRGRLVSGMGEGAYYVGLAGYSEQFRSGLGYVPFPGTLNVRLDRRTHQGAARRFGDAEGVMIDGFSDGKRTYGWVKCVAARIGRIDCHLIIPERTHHDDSIIELISAVCIRKAARLKDGSGVTVEMSPDA